MCMTHAMQTITSQTPTSATQAQPKQPSSFNSQRQQTILVSLTAPLTAWIATTALGTTTVACCACRQNKCERAQLVGWAQQDITPPLTTLTQSTLGPLLARQVLQPATSSDVLSTLGWHLGLCLLGLDI